MKFNKYLAMCFLASTLMCGSFTSCGDDDDDAKKEAVLNDKTTAEQGREDGKNFGTIAAKGSNISVSEVSTLLSLSSKYKKTDDKVYKTAFAEGAAETGLLGDSTTGDEAVAKIDEIINDLEKAEDIKNGTQEQKISAIISILNLFNGNKSAN